MLNSGIIWHVWLVPLVVFHAVHMLWLAPFDYLSFTSTNVNCKNTSSRNTLSTSPISFTHLFSHSQNIHTLFICYLPVRNIIYSESYYYMEQNNMVPRHSDIPIIYEMISKISKYQYC